MVHIVKIAVLGDPNVGKTSLVRRHAYQKFEDSYLQTIGVDLTQITNTLEDGSQVVISVWDIAGQESFAKLRRIYLKAISGAILVFDLTSEESFLSLDKWYDSAEEIAGKVPIVVVGNKDDLEAQVDEQTIMSKMNKEGWSFYRTSAKTGKNVDLAFKEVAKRGLGRI